MSERRWNNVSGELKITLYRHEGELYSGQNFYDADDEAPTCLLPYVQSDKDDSTYELVIDFLSSGYSKDAEMYGGPDNLGSPSEFEDDRILESVTIIFTKEEAQQTEDKPLKVELPKEVQHEVFAYYLNRIEHVEIETGD